MNEIEMALVCFINECHRSVVYHYEKYQMLHNVKYKDKLENEYIQKVRKAYPSNCFEAAYELKTYYIENDILSNTIVLKMRPKSPEINKFTSIKVYSDITGEIKEYSHHAIEVFKEHGKYKVLDILHSDKKIWLETYLDELCKVNHCERSRLRYDLGYLAPCHAFASNMQELSDLMRYLDKEYCIGKPRVTIINLGKKSVVDEVDRPVEEMLLSDDIAMDFDEFGKQFGEYDGKKIIAIYPKVYDKLMEVRFNLLHMLCMGHIMRDPIMQISIVARIFDDAKILEFMDLIDS